MFTNGGAVNGGFMTSTDDIHDGSPVRQEGPGALSTHEQIELNGLGINQRSNLPATDDNNKWEKRYQERFIGKLSMGYAAVQILIFGVLFPLTELFSPKLEPLTFRVPGIVYRALGVLAMCVLLLCHLYEKRRAAQLVHNWNRCERESRPITKKESDVLIVEMVNRIPETSAVFKIFVIGFGILATASAALTMAWNLTVREHAPSCWKWKYLADTCLDITFICLQLVILARPFEIHTRRLNRVAKFCLAQLLASNLSTALNVVILEAIANIVSVELDVAKFVHPEVLNSVNKTIQSLHNCSRTNFWDESTRCGQLEPVSPLILRATPYLYPNHVQFAIAMTAYSATLWRYHNNRCRQRVSTLIRKKMTKMVVCKEASVRKLHFYATLWPGILTSLLLLGATAASGAMFLISASKHSGEPGETESLQSIYLQLVLSTASFFLMAATYGFARRMRPRKFSSYVTFLLIWVCTAGSVILLMFLTLGAFHSTEYSMSILFYGIPEAIVINHNHEELKRIWPASQVWLECCCNLLSALQVALQTLFILDIQRRATPTCRACIKTSSSAVASGTASLSEQSRPHPLGSRRSSTTEPSTPQPPAPTVLAGGQRMFYLNAIAVLMTVNVCYYAVFATQVVTPSNKPVQLLFFSYINTLVVFRFFQPLAITYRFISAVILFDHLKRILRG